MISDKNMNKFVTLMTQEFMKQYNAKNAKNSYLEYASILENGYCFYFAYLLKTLIPEGTMLFTGSHYLFLYNGKYYDYRGEIDCVNDQLLIDYYAPTPISSLLVTTDINYEWGIASLSGITDNEKDRFYASIEQELLKSGSLYLEELLNQEHTISR